MKVLCTITITITSLLSKDVLLLVRKMQVKVQVKVLL